MATSFTLQNDPALPQGYLKVDGSTSAIFTTTGITGNLTGNVTGNVTGTATNAASGSQLALKSAKAWVNFDGTLATPSAFGRSYNVSSITKHAAGEYTINFSSALTDSNYSVSGNAKQQGNIASSNDSNYIQLNTLSTTGVRIYVTSGNINALRDSSIVAVIVFGN